MIMVELRYLSFASSLIITISLICHVTPRIRNTSLTIDVYIQHVESTHVEESFVLDISWR